MDLIYFINLYTLSAVPNKSEIEAKRSSVASARCHHVSEKYPTDGEYDYEEFHHLLRTNN